MSSIAQGSTTLTYDYSPEHGRIQQVAPEGTTVYVSDPGSGISLEKFIGASVTQWNEYLFADGRAVGEHFTRSDSTTYIRYFIGDHLSSVSVLTDETGTVTERLSYDAWGKRRNADGSDASGAIASATTRGFTDQEHIDDVGLINYNARLYDPAIGRFQSADSIVPGALNGQAFNRYSYVLNRPLSLVDPTGHQCTNADGDPTPCPQQDGGGGMPCWGCSGPGEWEGQSVVGLEFVDATITSTAGWSESYFGTLNGLLADVYNIASVNAVNGITTNTIFNLPGISGTIDFGISSVTVIEGEDGDPVTTYGLGHITASTGTNWYTSYSTFVGGLGIASDFARYGSGAAAIGSGLRFYANGWHGNQFVRTTSIAGIAHGVGTGALAFSVLLDIWANDNHLLSDNDLDANLYMDAVSLIGWPGAVAGIGYYATDQLNNYDPALINDVRNVFDQGQNANSNPPPGP